MSQFQSKPKPRGALFQNLKKEKETHPDYRGNIELDKETIKAAVEQVNNGAQFAKLEVAGWNKVGQNAGDFISLVASKPYVKPEGHNSQPTPQPAPQPVHDDKIPF